MMWVDKPKIVIPVDILVACQAIQKKLGKYEFSILVKPAEIKPYTIVLSTDYVIPKQKVSCSSIDYDCDNILEQIKNGYNVVIHSHHDMSCGFSDVDKKMLHQGNIVASILFAKNVFKKAVILVKSEMFGIAEIEANIEIMYPDIDVSNIEIYNPPLYNVYSKKKKSKKQNDYYFDIYHEDFFIY